VYRYIIPLTQCYYDPGSYLGVSGAVSGDNQELTHWVPLAYSRHLYKEDLLLMLTGLFDLTHNGDLQIYTLICFGG